jgi:hypothetical protein
MFAVNTEALLVCLEATKDTTSAMYRIQSILIRIHIGKGDSCNNSFGHSNIETESLGEKEAMCHLESIPTISPEKPQPS